MKYKTTLKAIRNNYNNVIRIGYCDAVDLLAFRRPVAYNSGVYGWNCDLYDFGDVAICTGYRPTGNIRPAYQTVRKYEEKARIIARSWDIDLDEKKTLLDDLLYTFIDEVTKED